MNNSDCEILLVLLEEKNITKAAERLYTSQSTLSYRIKNLERELGCILFERSKTGIAPTQECQLVAEFARTNLAEYEALTAQLAERRSSVEKSEKLILGTATSIAVHFFNQLQRAFQNAYPHVEVSLIANTSHTIMNMLEEKALDIAIVRGEYEWSGKKVFLYEEPVCLVSHQSIDLKKILDVPYLVQPIFRNRGIVFKWLNEHFGTLPKNIIEIDSVDACLQMVGQGLGFAILPALSLVGKKGFVREQLWWQDGRPLSQKTWCLCWKGQDARPLCPFIELIRTTLPEHMAAALQGNKM